MRQSNLSHHHAVSCTGIPGCQGVLATQECGVFYTASNTLYLGELAHDIQYCVTMYVAGTGMLSYICYLFRPTYSVMIGYGEVAYSEAFDYMRTTYWWVKNSW